MNTQTKTSVVVGAYNEENVKDLLDKLWFLNIELDIDHCLISLIDWPKRANKKRVEVFPFFTNNPEGCSRFANLFELLAFALKNPSFPEEVGSIEGSDQYLEELSDFGIDLTVPVFGLKNNKPTIFLRRKIIRPVTLRLGAIVY